MTPLGLVAKCGVLRKRGLIHHLRLNVHTKARRVCIEKSGFYFNQFDQCTDFPGVFKTPFPFVCHIIIREIIIYDATFHLWRGGSRVLNYRK